MIQLAFHGGLAVGTNYEPFTLPAAKERVVTLPIFSADFDVTQARKFDPPQGLLLHWVLSNRAYFEKKLPAEIRRWKQALKTELECQVNEFVVSDRLLSVHAIFAAAMCLYLRRFEINLEAQHKKDGFFDELGLRRELLHRLRDKAEETEEASDLYVFFSALEGIFQNRSDCFTERRNFNIARGENSGVHFTGVGFFSSRAFVAFQKHDQKGAIDSATIKRTLLTRNFYLGASNVKVHGQARSVWVLDGEGLYRETKLSWFADPFST